MKTELKHAACNIVTDLSTEFADLDTGELAAKIECEMLAILRASHTMGASSDISTLRDRARVVLATLEQLGLV